MSLQKLVHFLQVNKFIMFYKVNQSNSLLDSYANIRIQSDLRLGHVKCLLLMLARKTEEPGSNHNLFELLL